METVVKVDGVSKVFRLGDVGASTLTDDIRTFLNRLRGKSPEHLMKAETNDRTSGAGSSDYVWALKDVDFEVAKGEIVGLVGRNGAGKSTLLKILSRTTAPSSGEIRIKGKVASLLEVGTGFHPDLSGRDNIFLNGAILGMRKAEIRSKFDQIVEFAGVQRYIDTPVKRYSSGMYVRLAFAVAAHLDPDILIIDEVLAVGDAEFQAKCLGKMKDVSDQGRTVLFVSHNMGAVADLCTRAILLKHGSVFLDGPTDEVIRTYVEQNMKTGLSDDKVLQDATVRRGTGEVRYQHIEMLNSRGEACNEFYPGESVEIRMKAIALNDVSELQASIGLRSGRTRDFVTTTGRCIVSDKPVKQGEVLEFRFTFTNLPLRPGVFETYFWLGDARMETAFDVVDNLLAPLVVRCPPETNSLLLTGYFDIPFTFERSNN